MTIQQEQEDWQSSASKRIQGARTVSN
jgi:hypothetical protein